MEGSEGGQVGNESRRRRENRRGRTASMSDSKEEGKRVSH